MGQILVAVNGDATWHAHEVAAGSTVSLEVVAPQGFVTCEWEYVANSHDDVEAPEFTLTGPGTATFACLADQEDGGGRGYLLRCIVDRYRDTKSVFTFIVGYISSMGVIPYCAGETLERDPIRGWTRLLQTIWALIPGGGGLAGVPWANVSGKPTTLVGYNLDDDVAAALVPYLKRDGTNAATGNLDLGGNKLRNGADGILNSDFATVGQVATAINQAVAGIQQTVGTFGVETLTMSNGGAFTEPSGFPADAKLVPAIVNDNGGPRSPVNFTATTTGIVATTPELYDVSTYSVFWFSASGGTQSDFNYALLDDGSQLALDDGSLLILDN